MVVGRTGIVDTPKEVVQSVALEHVGSLAEGVVLECAALGSHQCHATLHDAHHVVVEFGASHIAIAPVEVADACVGIGEYIHVNLLAVVLALGQVVYEWLVDGVGEGPLGIVGHGYADSLSLAAACIATEVEEVLVLIVDLLLDDGRCPSIAAGPRGLVAHVEVDAFVAPVYEVGR